MNNRATTRCVLVPDEEYRKLRSRIEQLKEINKQNHVLINRLKSCDCNIENKTDDIVNELPDLPVHPVLSQPLNVNMEILDEESVKPRSLADEIEYDLVFSKNQRRNARQIAAAAEQAFKWNKRGELIDDGIVLDRTNILHLIGFLLNPFKYKKEDIPEKLDYFLKKLKEKSNLPPTLIKNQSAKQSYVTGKGFTKRQNSSLPAKGRAKAKLFMRNNALALNGYLRGWQLMN